MFMSHHVIRDLADKHGQGTEEPMDDWIKRLSEMVAQ